MASHVVVYTLLLVGGFWQLQWIMAEQWEHWWSNSV